MNENTGKDKIREGWKELHPDEDKDEYVPHVAGKTKQLIQEGLEELKPSIGKDGKPLQRAKTSEEKILERILGEDEEDESEPSRKGIIDKEIRKL